MKDILEKINYDIAYHNSQLKNYNEKSTDWNFHLGWVDALTTYRWQIEEFIKDSNK